MPAAYLSQLPAQLSADLNCASTRTHTSNKRRERLMSDPIDNFDVIIVGGGSAGAVLAARLSEESSRKIVLLEAGHAYAPDRFPAALLDASTIADPDHDWGAPLAAMTGTFSFRLRAERSWVAVRRSTPPSPCGPPPAISPNGARMALPGGATRMSFLLSGISKTRPPETISTTGATARCRSGKEQMRS